MSWRVARAIKTLQDELVLFAPKRDKASDGTIGDAAHSSRESQHNPNRAGVVTAIDLTHDEDWFDAHRFANELVKRCKEGKERRVWYVISNGRIASKTHGWTWLKYGGDNKHDKHIHISFNQSPLIYDNGKTWKLETWATKTRPKPKEKTDEQN